MAENTKIEWADHTFNPWEGCQKVGPGCDHCYAEARNARFGAPKGQPRVAINWGPGAVRRRTSPANWNKPLQWQADAPRFMAEHGRRQRVFCASLADVFDNAVEDMWRAELANLISDTPDLDWLLLTKRIGNAAEMLQIAFDGSTPPNVWLGATIVNQQEADRDIPKLLATPASVRFLSMEPLLGPVDLRDLDLGYSVRLDALTGASTDDLGRRGAFHSLDWAIVGGESGRDARAMHPDWVRALRDQCQAAGVPFLFKQWGEWVPLLEDGNGFWPSDEAGFIRLTAQGQRTQSGWPMQRVGKKAAGRLLDDVEHNGLPAALSQDFANE